MKDGENVSCDVFIVIRCRSRTDSILVHVICKVLAVTRRGFDTWLGMVARTVKPLCSSSNHTYCVFHSHDRTARNIKPQCICRNRGSFLEWACCLSRMHAQAQKKWGSLKFSLPVYAHNDWMEVLSRQALAIKIRYKYTAWRPPSYRRAPNIKISAS